MKTEVKKLDKLKRVMTVEVGQEFLQSEKKQVYKELSKKLKVPGFRPGTAPDEILEKHHGKVLKDELIKKAVPVYYGKALEENKLEPVTYPKVENVALNDDKLSFSAEFEVKPQLELKDEMYKGIKIKKNPIKVEAVEIEKFITQLKDSVKKMSNKDYDDATLAKWSGYSDVDMLKEAIRMEISTEKLRMRRAEMENNLGEQILKKIKIDVPQGIIEDQQKKLIQQELYKLRMQNIKEEDLEKYKNDLEDKMKPLAEKQVKLYYILEEIAKREGLQINAQNLFDVVVGFILSCANYA